jgi:molybdate transport system substrate-binding protein
MSCQTSHKKSLIIATAANVQFAMDTLAYLFEKENSINVNIILGSSGKLTAQIMQGAPYDVFISADMKYPSEIYDNNLAFVEPEVYAYGSLVIWSLKDSVDSDLDVLTDPEIRRIAIPNPKTAPYGTAAIELLKNMDLLEQVEQKLVYGESVSQVNQFLLSETADIGFTSKSVVLSPKMKNRGTWIEADTMKYAPIEQGVILIRQDTSQLRLSEKFLAFLLSSQAKSILSDFGYKTKVSQ